jgi:hypothetical protein
MLQTIKQVNFYRLCNSINSSNKQKTKYKDPKIKFYVASDNKNLDPLGQLTSLDKRDSSIRLDYIIMSLSDNFYHIFYRWIFEKNGQFVKWAENIIRNRDLTGEQAAALVQRAHRRYIKKTKIK